MPSLLAMDFLLIAASAWLAVGLSGLAAPRNTRFIAKVLFPLGALIGHLRRPVPDFQPSNVVWAMFPPIEHDCWLDGSGA